MFRNTASALIVLFSLCWAARAAPPAGEAVRPIPRGEVVLPSGRILLVEVADTPATRERGYMYRERIGDEEGMVFIMEGLGFHPFWMKNCRVPLDILWLDETWTVAHIESSLPPCREEPCPNYLPMRASRYVLEVRAGLSRELGLRLGDHIIFTPISPPPAGR